MYKKRLQKWGLDTKNIRSKDAEQVVLRKRQRDAVGKQAHRIIVRGRRFEWEDIERHLRRNPRLRAKTNTASQQLEIGSSTDVIVRTPSPDPALAFSVPPLLEADDDLRVAEELGRILRDYIRGQTEARLWVVQDAMIGPSSKVLGATESEDGLKWANDFTTEITTMLEAGYYTAGFQRLDRWLGSFQSIIRNQDFGAIMGIIAIFFEDLVSCEAQLSRCVARHLIDITARILSERHPLALVQARLHEANNERQYLIASVSFGPVLDLLHDLVGQGSQWRMWRLRVGYWKTTGNPAAETQDILSYLAETVPRDIYGRFFANLRLSGSLAYQGKTHEADRALHSASGYLNDHDSLPQDRNVFNIYRLRIYHNAGKINDVDDAFVAALDFAEATFGSFATETLRLIGLHQNMLKHTGRLNVAAQVAADLARRIEERDALDAELD